MSTRDHSPYVGVLVITLILGDAGLHAGVPGSPAQLWIDTRDALNVGEPLALNVTVVSQVKSAAQFELQILAPPGVDWGFNVRNLSGSISGGDRRTITFTLTGQKPGDFRVPVKLRFQPKGASSAFIIENSAVFRLRATKGISDVFVEQKDWPRKQLADRIKVEKESLRGLTQEERDRQINVLQNLPADYRSLEYRVPEVVINRQQLYGEAKSQGAQIKQQWLGSEWAGHVGSSERYADVDGLIRRGVPVGFIYRKELSLRAGEPYVLETRNLTAGSDTVAYLFAYDEASGELTAVARNDDADRTTLASRIKYTPDRDGSYLFVVRSYNSETRGAADIYVNAQFVERTRFAGLAFAVTADAGDAIQTVALRRTPNRTDTLMFVWPNAGGAALWDDDGGMELGSKLVLPELRSAELVLGAYSNASEGSCDLILNTTDGSHSTHPRGDLDGDGLSNELERALGTDPELQDTDSDGFLDSWEALGVRDTDYPAFGANGTVADVYVQVDWMASTHNHKPRPEAIQMIVDSFYTTAVNLHVDDGNPDEGGQGHLLPDPWTHLQYLTLGPVFNQIKAENFDSAKRSGLYRYNIFAHQQAAGNCSSGIANIRGFNFLVTLGCGVGQIGTVNEQAGTFMHELGHNLGLRHGGFEDLNYKPNYRSVMNYLFQFQGTCGRVGYTTGVTYTPCSPREFFYSFGGGPDLDENCLDENLGVGEGPIDWDGDGQLDKCVRVDINHPVFGRPDGRFDLLRDYYDYSDLFIPLAGFATTMPMEQEIVTCPPPPEA